MLRFLISHYINKLNSFRRLKKLFWEWINRRMDKFFNNTKSIECLTDF